MKLFGNIRLSSWFGYVLALCIAVFIVIFSNWKVKELKEEEVHKMVFYAQTLELLNSEKELPVNIQKFLVQLIEQNTTIPVILVDEEGRYLDSKNVTNEIITDPSKLKKELKKMSGMYKPISITLPFGKQYIYYKNSLLLSQLEYYPMILIIVIVLFVWFTYWYFKTIRKTEQSLLWAGMAKETAHQLGTPLSSIMGWLEILKSEEIDQRPVSHIEKDIHRLLQVTDRFSKIGSVAVLKQEDLVDAVEQALKYLRNRLSKQIEIKFDYPENPVLVNLNVTLFSWVMENLIKNAADAMINGGIIEIRIQENIKDVYLDVSDQGQGISSSNLRKIFKPGFTTKKRGWGLGLSLVKRAIEDYHKGRIFVLNSEINKGTIFRIVLKKKGLKNKL